MVFSAGSLARPVAGLLSAYTSAHPGVVPQQENSGSVEAARKLTELHKVPDLIAVADYGVIGSLLMPAHAAWYAAFARNAMVLAYTKQSAGAAEITSENWYEVLQRPGIRTGRSDPALDPAGYRTIMVTQLAERYYRRPGLGSALLGAMPARYERPKEADLTALLEAGELDYVWTYRSLARTAGLSFIELPVEINLSDPAHTTEYSVASVTIPGPTRDRPAVTFHGEPIVYALTVPLGAPHPARALDFARYMLGPEGRRVLAAQGFTLLDAPVITGTPPSGLVSTP